MKMKDEHNLTGTTSTAKVSAGDDGKVKVEAQFESRQDALAAADELTRSRTRQLHGLDKLNALDEYVSPRLRQTGEVFFRTIAVAFGAVLGLVVALSSGDAARLIFPDAPMPSGLLWLFGALTVPGGIWAADELLKTLKDDVDNKAQRVRISAFAAVVASVLLFDSLGVLTARVAHTSGAIVQIDRARGEARTLERRIQQANMQLAMMELPSVPSTTLVSRIAAEIAAPTRTGRPVQTVGELMMICEVEPANYCLSYRNQFARIKYLQGEYDAAKAAESAIPALEEDIGAWQMQLAEMKTVGADEVDQMFCSSSDDENCARSTRFWRTAVISIGQVILLAIIWLLILEDRHTQLAKRRQTKLAEAGAA